MSVGAQLMDFQETIAHVPALYSTQHLWLDWIYGRFTGVRAAAGCSMETLEPSRGMASTECDAWEDYTFFLEYDEYGI